MQEIKLSIPESETEIWFVYILECADGTYYTGISDDIITRIKKHNSNQGAKYTRGRGPCNLVYQKEIGTHGSALKREIEIKKLSKKKKLELILLQSSP